MVSARAQRYDPVRQMLLSIADDLWVAEQPLRYLGVALIGQAASS